MWVNAHIVILKRSTVHMMQRSTISACAICMCSVYHGSLKTCLSFLSANYKQSLVSDAFTLRSRKHAGELAGGSYSDRARGRFDLVGRTGCGNRGGGSRGGHSRRRGCFDSCRGLFGRSRQSVVFLLCAFRNRALEREVALVVRFLTFGYFDRLRGRHVYSRHVYGRDLRTHVSRGTQFGFDKLVVHAFQPSCFLGPRARSSQRRSAVLLRHVGVLALVSRVARRFLRVYDRGPARAGHGGVGVLKGGGLSCAGVLVRGACVRGRLESLLLAGRPF